MCRFAGLKQAHCGDYIVQCLIENSVSAQAFRGVSLQAAAFLPNEYISHEDVTSQYRLLKKLWMINRQWPIQS